MRKRAKYSAFGEAVSDCLSDRDMTQSDLSAATGRSAAYTNQTMTGVKRASPQWVELVADALKLSRAQRTALHRAAAKDSGFQIDLGTYKG